MQINCLLYELITCGDFDFASARRASRHNRFFFSSSSFLCRCWSSVESHNRAHFECRFKKLPCVSWKYKWFWKVIIFAFYHRENKMGMKCLNKIIPIFFFERIHRFGGIGDSDDSDNLKFWRWLLKFNDFIFDILDIDNYGYSGIQYENIKVLRSKLLTIN